MAETREPFMIVLTVTPEQVGVYREALEHMTVWADREGRAAAHALLKVHPTTEQVADMLADAEHRAAAHQLRTVEWNKGLADVPDPVPGMGMDVDTPGLD